MKKENIINQIDSADSQTGIKDILERYYSTPNDELFGDKVTDILAEDYDIEYKSGVDDNLGSDGKAHNFGQGKYALCGDNIPGSLEHAKNAIINTIIEDL